MLHCELAWVQDHVTAGPSEWHQERHLSSQAYCVGMRKGHGGLHSTLDEAAEKMPTSKLMQLWTWSWCYFHELNLKEFDFCIYIFPPNMPISSTLVSWDAKAAMDAVNVDLDEMRARVDSTHSIITSRQRVEVIKSLGVMTLVLQFSALTRGNLKFYHRNA